MHRSLTARIAPFLLGFVAFVFLLSQELAGATSPSVPLDEQGARVLSKLPPIGVHPRVFFTADELPRIRQRLDTSTFGKTFKESVLANVEHVRQEYRDLAMFDADDITPELVAQHVKPNEGRNIQWGMASVYAAAYEDAELKDFVASVITSYGRLLLASKELGVGGEAKRGTGPGYTAITNLWKDTEFGVGQSWTIGAAGLAVSYDVLYNDMTEAQRSAVRSAIAVATKGRTPYGSGLPVGFGVSNHYGYHGDLAVLLCAIEGEEGYDRDTYENIRRILLDYWNTGFTALGACHEDGYGPNLGLRAGSRGLVALARRGDNVFATEKYRNYLDYVVTEFEPFPGGAFLGGASGGPYVELYPTNITINRYMHPNNPAANLAYRHILGDRYERRLRWQGHLDFLIFGGDWQGPATRAQMYQATGLALARFYPERGKLISRSDWSDNAMQFTFDARPDAFVIGHDSVDRGNFTLASHGRVWAYTGDFHQFDTSAEHSLVHVDGKAQPWKAPSVRFLTHDLTPVAATGSADLKYAYDWQWSPPWASKAQRFAHPWEKELSDPRDLGWLAEHAPAWLPTQLYGSQTGYASALPAGNWLHRRPYNRVRRAIRAVAAVRGHRPYAVVADDIQKDTKPHAYSWFMQLPIDVELKARRGADLILGEVGEANLDGVPAPGRRRLLVRVLQVDTAAGGLGTRVEDYVAHVDTRRNKETPARRLILEVTAVAPNFKIMLFPYFVGEPLPATSWKTPGKTLSVQWDDQQDELTFTSHDKAYRIEVRRTKSARPLAKPVILGSVSVTPPQIAGKNPLIRTESRLCCPNHSISGIDREVE